MRTILIFCWTNGIGKLALEAWGSSDCEGCANRGINKIPLHCFALYLCKLQHTVPATKKEHCWPYQTACSKRHLTNLWRSTHPQMCQRMMSVLKRQTKGEQQVKLQAIKVLHILDQSHKDRKKKLNLRDDCRRNELNHAMNKEKGAIWVSS